MSKSKIVKQSVFAFIFFKLMILKLADEAVETKNVFVVIFILGSSLE